MQYFRLEGKTVIPVNDLFLSETACVLGTELPDGVFISTVFIGIGPKDANGNYLIFETMIFGGEHDGCQWKYATYEEAEVGHQKAIELIFE